MTSQQFIGGALVVAVLGMIVYLAEDGPLSNPKPSPPLPAPGYVVVVTQSKCPPCDKLKAELKQVKGVDIRFVDIRKAKSYGVKATPTSIRFVGEKEVSRREGYMPAAEFLAWLDMRGQSTPVRDLQE